MPGYASDSEESLSVRSIDHWRKKEESGGLRRLSSRRVGYLELSSFAVIFGSFAKKSLHEAFTAVGIGFNPDQTAVTRTAATF